jgi:hypothetical protein
VKERGWRLACWPEGIGRGGPAAEICAGSSAATRGSCRRAVPPMCSLQWVLTASRNAGSPARLVAPFCSLRVAGPVGVGAGVKERGWRLACWPEGIAQGRTWGREATPPPGRKRHEPEAVVEGRPGTRLHAGPGVPTGQCPPVAGSWSPAGGRRVVGFQEETGEERDLGMRPGAVPRPWHGSSSSRAAGCRRGRRPLTNGWRIPARRRRTGGSAGTCPDDHGWRQVTSGAAVPGKMERACRTSPAGARPLARRRVRPRAATELGDDAAHGFLHRAEVGWLVGLEHPLRVCGDGDRNHVAGALVGCPALRGGCGGGAGGEFVAEDRGGRSRRRGLSVAEK